MSNENSDGGEVIGALVSALVVLMLVVMAVMIAIMTLMTVGTAFGAGTALRNYGLAFANNVKPRRVKP